MENGNSGASVSRMPPALLERFMRDYYFDADADIGSSGVENFSFAEIRHMTGLTQEELDRIVFHDSQTLGNDELRQAIARHEGIEHDDWVIPTHGSSEAIFLSMNALLNPGDEVVVLDPCYQQLSAFAENLGCVLKRWPLRFENRFVPDLEEGTRLINSRTRMVVVNFPHNPTGMSVTAEEQSELLRAAERVGAYLIWDDAFSRLTYDSAPLPTVATRYERAIALGTFSKAYGLPGLRVGWCLASPKVLERFAHLRDYTILHLSPLVELIACRVLENAESLLAVRRRQAAANLGILSRWIEEQEERIDWVPPKGGVCCFPALREEPDVDALCRRLATEHRVLLVPGSCFGQPRHVRLGFGASSAELRTGLARLSELLRAPARRL